MKWWIMEGLQTSEYLLYNMTRGEEIEILNWSWIIQVCPACTANTCVGIQNQRATRNTIVTAVVFLVFRIEKRKAEQT